MFTKPHTEVELLYYLCSTIIVFVLFFICLDQSVAVKIIQKRNKETATSVTRESNILGWNHENIIQILKVRYDLQIYNNNLLIDKQFRSHLLMIVLQ